MAITRVKTWVLVFFAVRIFIDGSEESFILPTAWYYINTLNQTKVFLGMVTAAYSISAVIFVPMVGKFADKFGYMKPIIVFTYCMKFAGNLIYSLPFLDALPLLGRIISGIGDGAASVIYGQVALHTSQRNMAKVFLFLDSMFVVGTSLGPAVSSFLTFKVNLLGWSIDAGNSPGVVLAIIWFVLLVAACFLPNQFGDHEILSEKLVLSIDGSEDDENDSEDSAVNRPAVPAQAATWCTVFCLYYVIFATSYYSGVASFYTPLLGSQHFHLQFTHVKLLFLVSSMFAFAFMLILSLATEYVKAKKLMIFLILQHTVPIGVLTYCAYTWQDVSTKTSYLLLLYLCLGMAYFAYALCASMLCEITDPEDTAFYQGLCYSTVHLAWLLSRIISSYLFTKITLLYYCIGLASSWFLAAFWFAKEYSKL